MKLHYSQTFALLILSSIGFTTLWNYTTLKRATAGYRGWCSFTTLWNYTTLKPHLINAGAFTCFTTLWNYTTLKPARSVCGLYSRFTTLWNYTTLKHSHIKRCRVGSFTTLWNYTTLKHRSAPCRKGWRFTTLWNYTTLKLIHHCQLNNLVLLPYEITLLSNSVSSSVLFPKFYYLMKLHYSQTSNENKLRHYNSQGNIIKWLYYKPKIIFLQQFRTYLYPKYKDFLAEVSESCFDFQ